MIRTVAAPPDPIDPPVAPQFKSRTVLVLITAVAVICAITAPWVRAWPLEKQMQMLGILGFMVAGLAIGTTFSVILLLRIQRRLHAPTCRVRLLTISSNSQRAVRMSLATIAFVTLLNMSMGISNGVQPRQSKGRYSMPWQLDGLRVGLAACGLAAFAVLAGRLPSGMVLCEHGVAMRRLFPWRSIRKHSWTTDVSGQLHTLHIWTGQTIVDLPVSAHQRDEVDCILIEQVERANSRTEGHSP